MLVRLGGGPGVNTVPRRPPGKAGRGTAAAQKRRLGSVLELAGVHLGPVQGRPPVHRRVWGLRGPQGLGGSLLRDLGVVACCPASIAPVPDRGDEQSQG